MNEIKIRGLTSEELYRLDQLKGQESRNEFLRQEIIKIIERKTINEVDLKYNELLKMTLKVIERNTEVLNMFINFSEEE